ncbi:MAG: hypothetical protein HY721_12670 [Planctomycetes bacterium]|nr:hypothetical protein [Planctomycetota bacterium]
MSIYLPTHRRNQEARSDHIRYKNLCREVERVLARDVPGAAAREVKARLEELDREELWDEGRRSDGFAAFVCRGFSSCYRLPGTFPELQVVGGSFHTKPLIRFLQGNSFAYHVLAVNLHRVALYEGHGDSIQEVPLEGVPQAPEGGERGSPEVSGAARGKGADRFHYGQGGPKEHAKEEIEKHFRGVAREVWKGRLRSSARPLVLAAAAHHQPIFRRVAQIPVLLEAGIVADPAKLSPEEIKAEARRVLEPEIQRRIAKVKDEFGLARSRGQGSDDLQEVSRSVMAGRVNTLIVESGRRIWGMLHLGTGEIVPGDSARNAYDVDLLDELAEAALVRGAQVYVLGKDEMPTARGLAAVFRY